jgi:hypothetical protein
VTNGKGSQRRGDDKKVRERWPFKKEYGGDVRLTQHKHEIPLEYVIKNGVMSKNLYLDHEPPSNWSMECCGMMLWDPKLKRFVFRLIQFKQTWYPSYDKS